VLNRAATALRLGASTLLRSQTYLGAQYRRLRTKLGAPKAITAMAHRLARLVYRMLKYGQQYIDKGAEYYEQRNRQQQIEFVRKKAAQLGLPHQLMCESTTQEVSGEFYKGRSQEKTLVLRPEFFLLPRPRD
jgi:transposase